MLLHRLGMALFRIRFGTSPASDNGDMVPIWCRTAELSRRSGVFGRNAAMPIVEIETLPLMVPPR